MLDLTQLVTAAFLVGVRVSALLTFAPFLGSESVPMKIKAGLAAALTYLLMPVVPHPALTNAGELVGVIMSEFAVGALLGLAVTFVMEAAQMAGQMVGMQVGFSLVNIIDPQTQVDTPVLSTMHQLLALLIFLQLNVHHWLLRGTAKSFEYLPPGSLHMGGAVVEMLLHAAEGIFVSAVQIAAPVLIATMTADIALGFISKATPQLQVLFLGLSVKTLLALTVWIGALAFWPGRFERYFAQAIQTGETLLHLAR